MFYIGVGIFFFLIGVWQGNAKGSMSPVIGGVLPIFGIILIFIGDRNVGLFFVFMFVTWFLLMQIFRFSTYHKYFFKFAPLLVVYAVLTAFLLHQFDFQNFFWWYFGFSSLYLFFNHQKQRKSKDTVDVLAGLEKEFVDSIPEGQAKQHVKNELSLSFSRTIKYHLLSSALFLLTFLFAGLYFIEKIDN
ncbi:MAG: hypothetical protein Q7R65_03710 [bacterium]|nr:hypothetical protein [bacterium]